MKRVDLLRTIREFGKIKDIDFYDEIYGESFECGDYPIEFETLHRGFTGGGIDFDDEILIINRRTSFGCECCGDDTDVLFYSFDDLTDGMLVELVEVLNTILDKKMIL